MSRSGNTAALRDSCNKVRSTELFQAIIRGIPIFRPIDPAAGGFDPSPFGSLSDNVGATPSNRTYRKSVQLKRTQSSLASG